MLSPVSPSHSISSSDDGSAKEFADLLEAELLGEPGEQEGEHSDTSEPECESDSVSGSRHSGDGGGLDSGEEEEEVSGNEADTTAGGVTEAVASQATEIEGGGWHAHTAEDEEGPEWSLKRRRDAGSSFVNGVADGAPGSSQRVKQEGRTCPPHPGFMWGVCIRCGQHKNDEEKVVDDAPVALRYIHAGLEVSSHEAARMRRHELQRLLSRKKLYLVLDLDHTLLNSARFSEVSSEDSAYLKEAYLGEGPLTASGVADSAGSLHRLPQFLLWTKLRPGVHQFLRAAADLFELVVYTNGERSYAQAMAALLDPSRRLFGERIISHGDSTRAGTKDLDVVLGADSAVLILDDTLAVWPRHRANLILVERYHFFPSSRLQFGLGGDALARARHDESSAHGQLASLLPALRQIHDSFFEHRAEGAHSGAADAADVRQSLAQVRRGILSGCQVAFSGIFPRDTEGRPQDHSMWRMAEDMGARCHLDVGPELTHLVARDSGTQKARWAAESGCHLVSPGWLEASLFLWSRQKEQNFPVQDVASAGAPPQHGIENAAAAVHLQAQQRPADGSEPTPGRGPASEINVCSEKTGMGGSTPLQVGLEGPPPGL